MVCGWEIILAYTAAVLESLVHTVNAGQQILHSATQHFVRPCQPVTKCLLQARLPCQNIATATQILAPGHPRWYPPAAAGIKLNYPATFAVGASKVVNFVITYVR